MMVFGIVWNIGGAVLGVVFISSMPPMPPNAPEGFAGNFAVMMKVMMAFNFLIVIAFSILFGWIVKKLMSSGIKQEFVPATPPYSPGNGAV